MNKIGHGIKHKVLDILLVAIILMSLSGIASADTYTANGSVVTANRTTALTIAVVDIPLSAINVSAWNSTTGAYITSSITDAAGFYELTELPAADMTKINITTAGIPGNYIAVTSIAVNSSQTSIFPAVTGDLNFSANLSLERVWNVSGYAKSYNGTGITGALATYNSSTTGFNNYYTTLASTGYYIIYGLKNGTGYVFNASKTVVGGLSTSASVTSQISGGGDPNNVNFTMYLYGLSGTVVDGSSIAVSSATITYASSTIATTNAAGAWSVPEAINGTYALSATKGGYADASGSFTIAGAAYTIANFILYAGSNVGVASRQKIQANTFSGFSLASIAAFILIAMGVLGLVISFVGTFSGGQMATKEIIMFSMAAMIVGVLLLIMSTIMEMITVI